MINRYTFISVELTPELLDKQTAAEAAQQPLSEDESDDSGEETTAGNVHDFSVALDDIDELLLKLTQSQPKPESSESLKMPQIDGADDRLPRTPTKVQAKMQRSPPRTPTTPKSRISRQQPRTPKSSAAKKYAPLPLMIVSKSAQSKCSLSRKFYNYFQ